MMRLEATSNRIRLAGTVLLVLLLAACATPPPPPGMIDNLRDDLQALEENTELTAMVPEAVADARMAVRRASVESLNDEQRRHLAWLAHKTIEIARAKGFAERARSDIQAIEQRRNQLLLRASRLEVEQAQREAERALMMTTATREEMQRARQRATSSEEQREEATREARQARAEAEQARRLTKAQSAEIELARREADLASQQAQSLQRRLEYMEYRETDRGVVITLGDVLFEVGEADLLPAAQESLGDVIELLESEPDKSIRIEGHTDSTGPAALNLRLSEQRARSVRDALAALGIDTSRMQAVGMGEDFPIASNETDQGRARNRRVDVIVLND
ncbi:MAG: OmpA family protein [Wenzhouxiangellaceae bacterium]|nr:OmpA family protein [Wenzhouxiangellaceae bacterium]